MTDWSAQAKKVRAHYREHADKNIAGRSIPDFEVLIRAHVEPVLQALSQIVAMERERQAKELAEVRAMAASKDSAAMLKGSFGAILSANLQALSRLADHVELRKSEVLAGEPSALIKAALQGVRK